MAVMKGREPITEFAQWYDRYEVDERTGCLEFRTISDCGNRLWSMYDKYKRETDARLHNYDKLLKLVDSEVISPKPDLPNVSSGETAGLVRRIARNLVQNTPNVEVISKFDDDSTEGLFAEHVLRAKVIGTDQYSNDMQQNLFSSTKSGLTLGFDCVIPLLLQDAAGSWYIKYDSIYYRDVFPEPGAKDVRSATNIFVRRYLTEGELHQLIRDSPVGWDVAALKLLCKNPPRARENQSVDHQTKKRGQIPDGYEIITWYSSTGEAFLTFEATTKVLLRIEKNKHPLRQHPVFFLVLEKDDQQPFGKSQVELVLGRQDFQDLMLNGAMKLWYRNINPSIIGYGAANAVPNLSPGKYTQISNPNAKIEPFEVNTQTLLQYSGISEQNLGSMINLMGSADQQMATQAGNGMSATPQGVEAQQSLVDITTNNYQKAIEGFFSHYCSYALTMYFQELKAVKAVAPTAEARRQLLKAGMAVEQFSPDGALAINFEELATEYFVRCIPGSLVEMEDEKQLRILNQLFVPLSQAMPALAATQNSEILNQAALAMQYIISKEIELSGSAHAMDIQKIWMQGDVSGAQASDDKIARIEQNFSGTALVQAEEAELNSQAIAQLQEQVSLLVQSQQALFEKLGVANQQPKSIEPTSEGVA